MLRIAAKAPTWTERSNYDMNEQKISCPFVYAKGHKCTGHVYRATAYGPGQNRPGFGRADVRKYRLWCSEKGDHAGIDGSLGSKLRMEFYPDQLPAGVEDMLWRSDILS